MWKITFCKKCEKLTNERLDFEWYCKECSNIIKVKYDKNIDSKIAKEVELTKYEFDLIKETPYIKKVKFLKKLRETKREQNRILNKTLLAFNF